MLGGFIKFQVAVGGIPRAALAQGYHLRGGISAPRFSFGQI
jgi:hypothetical protein